MNALQLVLRFMITGSYEHLHILRKLLTLSAGDGAFFFKSHVMPEQDAAPSNTQLVGGAQYR